MKYIFPAVITYSADEKIYYVDFPDTEGFFGCFTDGHSLLEAVENAEDALNLALLCEEEQGKAIPKASSIKEIAAKSPEDAIVTLIKADTEAYAKSIELAKTA